MLARVILVLVSLAMFGLTLKTKSQRYILLSAILTLSVLLTWTGIPKFISGGIILFMFSSLFVSIFQRNQLTRKNLAAISLFLTGIWSFISKLYYFMHWPYQGLLTLSLLIPILLFVIGIFRGIHKQKEFGVWVILIAEFGIQISFVVVSLLD